MTVRLFQPSMAGGELSPALHARTDLASYQVGLRKCRNFIVLRTGGVSTRPGFEFLGEALSHDGPPRLIPFRFNNTGQVCMLEFGDKIIRPWRQGAPILHDDGAPVLTPSPYSLAQAQDVDFVQSGDVLYFAHREHPPAKLSRHSWTDWRFSSLTFAPSQAAPVNLTARVQGIIDKHSETCRYRVSAVGANGEESLASAEVSIGAPTPDNWPVGTRVVLSWSAPPVGKIAHYRVYKAQNGIFGYVGMSAAPAFSDANVTPNLGDTAPEPNNPFAASPASGQDASSAAAALYPGVVAIHQQRLVFAGSAAQPGSLWMSRVGLFESMSRSIPSKDDDAVFLTLGSGEVNAIRGIASVNDLIVFTSGSEIVCNGGESGAPLTPSRFLARPQSYWGSGTLPPLVSGNTVLFIQGLGSAVRDLGYDYAVDGFAGNDRSILARHLFDGRSIVSWAYAQTPESAFWLVRDDGALLSLTYLREQSIGAWAMHVTDGAFERLAVIEGEDRHELYAVVRRTVNGQTRRYVERMAARGFSGTNPPVLLDSHLAYQGPPRTVFSGLTHLIGKSVGIVADGAPLAETVVPPSGTVVLPYPASHVAVGIGYGQDSFIETLALDPGMLPGQGSIQGRPKSIPRLTLRVERSQAFLAGPDHEHLFAVKPPAAQYGQAPGLIDGDISLTLDSGWNANGSVVIRPAGPMPLTILALIPDIVF